MKQLLILFFLPLITFGQNKGVEIDKSLYSYPKDSLIEAKVFIFNQVDSTNNKHYQYRYLFEEDNNKYLLIKGLGTADYDSSIYKVTDNNSQLIEYYKIIFISVLNIKQTYKGQLNYWGYDKSKDEPSITFLNYKKIGVFLTVINESNIKGEIDYVYKNDTIRSIELNEKDRLLFYHGNFPANKEGLVFYSKVIYGKGLGRIFIKTTNNKGKHEEYWQLESIIPYDLYLKKK